MFSSLQDTPRIDRSLWSSVMRRPSASTSSRARAWLPSMVTCSMSSTTSTAKLLRSMYLLTLLTRGPVGALIPVLPMTNVMSGTSTSETDQVLSPRLIVHRCLSEDSGRFTAIPPPCTHADASMGLPIPCAYSSAP